MKRFGSKRENKVVNYQITETVSNIRRPVILPSPYPNKNVDFPSGTGLFDDDAFASYFRIDSVK